MKSCVSNSWFGEYDELRERHCRGALIHEIYNAPDESTRLGTSTKPVSTHSQSTHAAAMRHKCAKEP